MYLQLLPFNGCIPHHIQNEFTFAVKNIHVGGVILYYNDPDVIGRYPVNLSNGAYEVYGADLLFLPPVKI